MLIDNDGFYYNIPKDEYEPIDLYYNRAWFIIKLKPSNLTELNDFIHYSFLWIHIKYKQCVYSEKIQNRIQELLEKN